METIVRYIGVPSRAATSDWIRRRVELRLDRHEHAVRRVIVTLGDVNGPRGGVDQQCVVHMRLRSGGRPVVVRAREATISEAVSKALDRARRRLGRRLDNLSAA